MQGVGEMTNHELGVQAINDLPTSIRVGLYDLAIEKWGIHQVTANRRWGEFSGTELMLRIQNDMPSPLKAADTFLHEVLHAIFWAYGVDDADKEERIVGTVSTALAALFRDNPWLAPWIENCMRPTGAQEIK